VRAAQNRERASALLEVASAMTGIGIVIHEAVIQVGCHVAQRAPEHACTQAVIRGTFRQGVFCCFHNGLHLLQESERLM
jgi:hypothetical protein